jgi:molybdopterin-containing oxidoreductase family iron-sulfur binding subunit
MSSLSPGERRDEFARDAAIWPSELSRRRFLELIGASAALASLGACSRPPAKTIVPYAVPPERELAADAAYYATAMPWEGYARGVLALSRSGRPTKLEGNPKHPDSLGATDAMTQAAVLSLYDPDRSRVVRKDGVPATWSAFEAEWLARHRTLTETRGRGLALLTEPTTSPTLLRAVHRLLDRFPEARWFQHSALPRHDWNGQQTDYDFSAADIVLAIDADFLCAHPSSLRYARAFASRRRIVGGQVRPNRLYVIEPALTLTGTMADHHIVASPSRLPDWLTAISTGLQGEPDHGHLTSSERRMVRALTQDLHDQAPRVVCVAGPHSPPAVRTWAAAMNHALHAGGVTCFALPLVRSDADDRCAGDLAALTQALRRHKFDTVITSGLNPVYTAPANLGFADAFREVPCRIHHGASLDETAAVCSWHLPESHFLESWSDLRSYDGTASIVQPLIAPLYDSRSAVAFIDLLATPPGRADDVLVRETWRDRVRTTPEFEPFWSECLAQGVVPETAQRRTAPKAAPLPSADELRRGTPVADMLVLIRPDPTVGDGRWTNNGWLQELPKPITYLVWENAAHLSPALATRKALRNGDVVRLRRPDVGEVEAPVWVTPGLADDCVLIHLAYGRTRAGTVGTGLGFDAFRVRASAADVGPIELHPTGRRQSLVTSQTHFDTENRDLVRSYEASQLRANHAPEAAPPSLYPDWPYNGYRWGMLIDLSVCTGCQACVIACQAENNTPVVGKEQVARGRAMHWLRVDQYLLGDPQNPDIRHQPVPCMQCENAPCELVCPVAATVHSSEGLNDMVYNRCIGTRYCSNNCPYKVRRFNFLDYRPPAESPLVLQQNPQVSIRSRGVMEKCTYCVQRINAGRIAAERQGRRIADGEVQTACQQACPVEAIVFGDLNDPHARVVARKAEPTHYTLLEELNTRPRTTYLARIGNRHNSAVGATEDSA